MCESYCVFFCFFFVFVWGGGDSSLPISEIYIQGSSGGQLVVFHQDGDEFGLVFAFECGIVFSHMDDDKVISEGAQAQLLYVAKRDLPLKRIDGGSFKVIALNNKAQQLLLLLTSSLPTHGKGQGLVCHNHISPFGLHSSVEYQHLVREGSGFLVSSALDHILQGIVGIEVDVIEFIFPRNGVPLPFLLALEQVGSHLSLLELVLSGLPVLPGLLNAQCVLIILSNKIELVSASFSID